ncbi:MAG: T9SS type A sorting domain-containing protein [Candidatus Cloacimonetes bacterium]|nr:T9SS type A sorting domain-containing protein [Candidatus Cloacimonadota bacterium]
MQKIIFVFSFLFICAFIWASVQNQKSVTDFSSGTGEVYQEAGTPMQILSEDTQCRGDNRLGLLWQTSDPTAIAHATVVSAASGYSFVGWNLNSYRVSLFLDNASPLWEHYTQASFEYPIDMTPCGSVLAVGDLQNLKIFSPASSTPTWQTVVTGSIVDLVLNLDGSLVYVASYDSDSNAAIVSCYEVGNEIPIWSMPFQGGCEDLVLSRDGSTLIFTQYGTVSQMWVMEADTGSIFFIGPQYNQNPPAISDDASLLVNGDYAGYLYVYEFDPDCNTYVEKWNFRINGTSAWVGGMAISGDGSTIAIGTLIFLSNDYDGEIYLFNSYSPNPVWVYQNVGDYIVDVDLSYDGSMLAAASWGPFNGMGPDFFLFRRQSNVPVFEINTPGSLFAVDITDDGSFCTTGGKAVHARQFGNGGLVYSVDCDLGGGFISGITDCTDSEDDSGVKVNLPELDTYYDYSDTNGDFTITNVPEGVYYVECSKVGYYTAIIPDVAVVEGETVSLGTIIMDPSGAPPQNFTASHASGITVELEWEAPAEGDPVFYHVFRKRYAQEPFPEVPLATLPSDQFYYEDNTALPIIHYYYTINAEFTDGLLGPYAEEQEGWICTGYVVDEISVYIGSTPVIDGLLSPGEWDDSFMVDCSDFWGTYDNTVNPIGSVIGYYKMNPEQTELYVAYINYNDVLLEDHDEVALYIDDNNDGTYPPVGDDSEGNYWAVYYASGNLIRYRPIYENGGVGTTIDLTDPQIEVSADAGYMVYEFVLPLGMLNWEITPSEDNQSGIGLFVLDDNTPDPHGFDAWWPYDNTNIFSPDDYGVISYGTLPQIPPPPENVTLTSDNGEITLTWDMPPINDFDHFNIFYSFETSFFELLDTTIGLTYQYEPPAEGYYQFYLTTVNHSGMESDPSATVDYNTTGNQPDELPLVTALQGNYPNPFNPETHILFQLAASCRVDLKIYNIKGQLVRNLCHDIYEAGRQTIVWDGRDQNGKSISSGIYFYTLKAGDYRRTAKMVLLK